MNYGFWGLLPSIAAILCAFVLKDVIASLAVGVILALIIYGFSTGLGFFDVLNTLYAILTDKMSENTSLIFYLFMLGSIVSLITLSGGHKKYGDWISRNIKTKAGTSFATIALGLLIFLDDYFNCLLIGNVMSPVTDRQNISRAKLAYFIDSTAAPVCIIAPISSWAMTIARTIEDAKGENGLQVFISSIPYNFYAVFTLLFVLYVALTNFNFGAMKRMEDNARVRETDIINNPDEKLIVNTYSDRASTFDLIFPNIFLVGFVIFSILYLGKFFDGEVSLFSAFGNVDTSVAMNYGCFATLALCFFMYVPRRIMGIGQFTEAVITGAKLILPAIAILLLSWVLSTLSCDFLSCDTYIDGLINNLGVNVSLLPLAIFVVSAIASFSLGSWGAFMITIPIIAVIADTTGSMLHVFIAATLSGAVFGDHCSPITDTTILASIGSGCNHIEHVKTQLPYALVICIVSSVSYFILGFSGSIILSYVSGFASLAAIIVLIKGWDDISECIKRVVFK